MIIQVILAFIVAAVLGLPFWLGFGILLTGIMLQFAAGLLIQYGISSTFAGILGLVVNYAMWAMGG